MPAVEIFSFVPLWLFVLALSAVVALLEIQIEGGNGWAACLPSWRVQSPWLKRLLNGKDLTGYHLYLSLELLFFFHFPAVFVRWTPALEFTIFSAYFAFMACEDFLWFVFNPHFGWRKFTRGNIAWFSRWAGPFPIDYYFLLLLSASCAWLSGFVSVQNTLTLPLQTEHLLEWGMGFLFFCGFAFLMIIVTGPYIRAFQKKDMGNHPGHPGSCVRPAHVPGQMVKAVIENVQGK